MEQPPEQETEQLAELSAGTIIADRYIIEKCIGMGSRSAVYLCSIQRSPDSLIAVKLMLPQITEQERGKFRKEVRASVSVTNPNVIRCLEQFSENGIDGFAMEYAAGGTLKELVADEAPVSLPRALGFAIDMCSGLQALHDIGIVHRDLKLRNLFLSSEDSLMIGDFGLCLLPGEQGAVEPGNVIGAIEYVSPEYVQTGNIDPRADIYAVGLLLYQLLSGAYPFPRSEQPVESLMKRLTSDPISLESINVSCPRRVSELIYRALERDPHKRFQSAAELEQELRACVSSFGSEPAESFGSGFGGGLFDSEPDPETESSTGSGLFEGRGTLTGGHVKTKAPEFASPNNPVATKSTKIMEAPTPTPPPEMTLPPFDAEYPNEGEIGWEDDKLHRKQIATKIFVGLFALLLVFGLVLTLVPGAEEPTNVDFTEETSSEEVEPSSSESLAVLPVEPQQETAPLAEPMAQEELEEAPVEPAEDVEPNAVDLDMIIGDPETTSAEAEVEAEQVIEKPKEQVIEKPKEQVIEKPKEQVIKRSPSKTPSAPKPISFSLKKGKRASKP